MLGPSERWKQKVKCDLSKSYTIPLLTPKLDENFIMAYIQLYILKMCTVEGTPERRLSSFKVLLSMSDVTFAGGAPLVFSYNYHSVQYVEKKPLHRQHCSMELRVGGSRTILFSTYS